MGTTNNVFQDDSFGFFNIKLIIASISYSAFVLFSMASTVNSSTGLPLFLKKTKDAWSVETPVHMCKWGNRLSSLKVIIVYYTVQTFGKTKTKADWKPFIKILTQDSSLNSREANMNCYLAIYHIIKVTLT